MKKQRARSAMFLLIPMVVLATAVTIATAPAGAADKIPRTASGKPDLSGTYDAATLTPMCVPRSSGTTSS